MKNHYTLDTKALRILISFSFILLISSISVSAQVTDIVDARSQNVGDTVSVTGILTTGSGEFNPKLRFLQDNTAGIALYGDAASSTERGDSIVVTGVLKDFNDLLEIDPITDLQVISSDNPLPEPMELTLADGFQEKYESMLLKFTGVEIINTTDATFQTSTNYDFTDGNTTQVISTFGNGGSDLIGSPIPSGTFDIVGLLGEFSGTHDLKPRDFADIMIDGPAILSLNQQNVSDVSFDVVFKTQVMTQSTLYFGTTTNYELDTVTAADFSKSHVVPRSSLSKGQVYEVKVMVTDSFGGTSTKTARMSTLMDISKVKLQSMETHVTTTGVVTNGPGEFNMRLRFFQTGTDGIAAYSDSVSGFDKGDSVVVTGQLKDFNGLLEIDPVYSARVLSSGNNVSADTIKLSDMGESYESMLVHVKDLMFDGPKPDTLRKGAYSIKNEAGTLFGKIWVDFSTNVNGYAIPGNEFDLTGIATEFNSAYRINPRSKSDFSNIVAGVLNVFRQNDFEVYPNPFSEDLRVRVENAVSEKDLNLRLFDLSGKLIYHRSLTSADNDLSLNLGSVPAGVYFLEISGDKNKLSYKVIKN